MKQIVGTTPHRKNIVDDGKDPENRRRKILYRAGIGGAAISAVAMVATTLAFRSQLAIVDAQLDNDPRSRQIDSAVQQMAPLTDLRGQMPFFYSGFASSGERLGRTRAYLQASMDLVEPTDISSPATISSAGSIVNIAPRIKTTILAIRELERYVHTVADPADPTRLDPSAEAFDVREHLAIAGSDISRQVNSEYSDYQRYLRPVARHIASRPYQLPLNASTSGLFLSLGLLVVAASMRRKKSSEISDEEALALGHTEKTGETDVRSDLSRGYRFVRYDLVPRFMKGLDEAGKNLGKNLEAIDAATDAGQGDASEITLAHGAPLQAQSVIPSPPASILVQAEKGEVTLEYTRNGDALNFTGVACGQADQTNVRVDLVSPVPMQQPAEADLDFVEVDSGANNPNRGKNHL